jgi:hypothetical protein
MLAGATATDPVPTPESTNFERTLLERLRPDDRTVIMDIRDYLGDPASDRAAVWTAQQLLIQECMSSNGFDYHPVPYQPITVDITGRLGERMLEERGRHGANTTHRQPLDNRTADPNAAYERDPAWLHAYSNERTEVRFDLPGGGVGGMSTGGCLGLSLRTLYGPDLTAYVRADMIATNLLSLMVKTALRSPPVTRAEDRWRGCMSHLGIPTDDTGEALTPDAASAAAACHRRTQLKEAYAAAFLTIAPDLLAQNRDALAAWKRYRVRGLQEATRVQPARPAVACSRCRAAGCAACAAARCPRRGWCG